MKKVRINDLAREMEVKSKVILDTLTAVGYTEHKTHSSAIEEDVAERVRRYLRGESLEPAGAAAADTSAPAAVAPPAETAAAPPSEPPAPDTASPAESAREHRLFRSPAIPPIAPPSGASKPKMPVPGIRPVYTVAPPMRPAAPIQRPPAAPPQASAETPATASPTPAPQPPPGSLAGEPLMPPPRPRPGLRIASSAPPAESAGELPRRVVVPVAGPRPTYTAPPPQPSRPTPGQPLVTRPAAGRPAPGRPIYGGQTRPAGAPQRSATPEVGRRPMHPTRPGGPAPRPAGPGRGHHLRREPRVKEGPMKYAPSSPAVAQGPLPITRSITLPEGVTVKDLAERLELKAKDVIRRLLDRGIMATVNQALEADVARDIAREFGAEATVMSFEEEAQKAVQKIVAEASEKLVPRAPVVTIMGHVDHGKTSLLDAIRETSVAAGEAGGITQHIGAYSVEVQDVNSPAYGRRIVFIDTPGHAAFTRMRARGASVTDIVVLVVAADDGIMPQTLEAIDHARAAGVPIVVAVNKVDKPDAQPERVKKQLADHNLLPEDWGGQTVTVEVSAKTKKNLNLLLEMILLVADLQGLKADPESEAQGTVVEAELDRGRGAVATLLVQNGTLHLGDTLIVGSVLGRVRAMFDDRGRPVGEAPPSTPVEVLGLETVPGAGDRFVVVNDRGKAKQLSELREQRERDIRILKRPVTLETLGQQLAEAGNKEMPLIVKADVQGSAEVLVDTLNKLSTDKVKIHVLHSGVGAINENDVQLAIASNAIIIGFNVRPEHKAAEMAAHEKIDIRLHSIIYELSDEIKKAMAGLLEPVTKETVLGHAEVRETFRIPKVGMVAGCYVRDGRITRDSQLRVVRDGVVVYTNRLASLRRFKEDTSEVKAGLECGVAVANFNDVKTGDVLEAFHIEKVADTL
jgi:translation initiation factor IF-2